MTTPHKEKELRKLLSQTAEAFKIEPEFTKAKARAIYKVALEAIEKLERVQQELNAYKAPKLFDKNEPPNHQALQPKTFLSPLARLKWFYENDREGPGMKRILETMNLTLIQAKELLDSQD